ncbi:alpha/beta hydrolase [Fictibacillus nanhaiensis]|uniref:alpha/beta hydrolase n=1 Tax=Fictibacillus nanhaiensis TaxID=742169 RepID=UPI001C966B61|nr:alpha/beta hydrolase [Fictibacillus nanhaiensis]MBY6036340.1 alpha/beta hydrolase [Fictibacillus nanhaiensis]
MSIEKRTFQIDNQWNIIHLPQRPNGFAILIIGDCSHYVDAHTSLWKQNTERAHLIQSLKKEGYTIFYSNLYGRHWGSPKAVTLAKRLYHYVMKHEILNPRIHVIAEGMGALAALRLMEDLEECIRSSLFINPCFDLRHHFHHERQNRLFFKRLVRELSLSYNVSENEVPSLIDCLPPITDYKAKTPAKIWHAARGVSFHFNDHSRAYEKRRLEINAPLSLSIHVPENTFNPARAFHKFFKENEKVL